MHLYEEELAAVSPDRETLLTVGVFDGVHIGHKYLISHARQIAGSKHLASGVITFKKHPLEVLAPETVLPYLTNCEEKVELLKAEKVDYVIPLTFSREMADLSAREFVTLLIKYLKMRALVVGMDFSLGKNREGDIPTLRKLGDELGFTVDMVEPLDFHGEVVSSTRIRKFLKEGNLRKVSEYLGRTFSLNGIVTGGDRRGRTIGFPTANIETDSVQSLLPDGVYATWTDIDGKQYPSVTNIGKRPTFRKKERTVETYVIGFQGDLYGKELKLEIVDLLRREKKFENAEELKKQIAEDIENSKAVLGLPLNSSGSTCSC
jgi:riboflavin kinase/FMN adenylyltransferase